VFHLDVPPGNIALADAQRLAQHPQVAQFIPLSLGDNLQGFRIVGTTPDYLALYGATLARGALWQAPMQAVLGAEVARRTALDVGARFAGAHGLAGGGAVHDTTPYTVSGVLRPCACVLDRLVLTATESVWAVHDELHADAGMSDADRAELDAALADEREITLGLVRYRSPLAAAGFPRFVNGSTPMQAAAPAIEITRLMGLIGQGTQLLHTLAAVLLAVATLSVFIALWSAVRERRADLAMLRMLGAPPRRVAGLLFAEAGWLALLSTVLGLLLALALVATAGLWWADAPVMLPAGVWPVTLAWVPALAAATALLAAGVPALAAYRTDVHTLLNPRS
jgi:putative ABC transport system permease protein